MTVSMPLFYLLPILFLLLQPWSIVTGADDDVCKQVNCGQGVCKPSDNITIQYECECSPGWKQVASTSNQYLKFLPCVIPNCTLDYSCSKAPPPVQQNENRGNGSFLDVCQWVDCGGGKCESTSFFSHKCECNPGYTNLLNLTFSPCFRECSLGMDCKDLNIGFKDPSSPPPPLSADRSSQENDVCKQVNCGQGICKPSNTSTSPYECECSPGWKQLAATSDQYLKFLPCVIPNCTLDYSCSKAPVPPVQQQENRGNGSIFDVCQWINCGGGTCESTSLLSHKCECNPGYTNLLNLTFSPCFRECSLGFDCKGLNIGFKDNPSSPPPPLSADRSNKAYNILEGRYDWLMILLTFALLGI